MNRLNKGMKVLLIAIFVALVARLYISFFIDGFIVTFAAIILALTLYFDEDIHPIHLGVMVAVISPGIRYVFEGLIMKNPEVFQLVYPDAFFYITYGLVFTLSRSYFGAAYKKRFYLMAFYADVIANLVELMVRTEIIGLKWPMIQGIILVGLIRTIIIMFFIYLAVNYTSMLVQEEHERRYQYLMLQSSRFKSEIYFLQKNMNQIENLVRLSHNLKKKASDYDEEISTIALEISKSMHEIKKDHMRVVRGLEEIYEEDMDFKEIALKDLFKIIEVNTYDFLHSKNMRVICSFRCTVDVMVKDHFYLMSVLRNLINNGIDACEGNGRIDVTAMEDDGNIMIQVRDNGSGIEESDAPYIFNNGFSNKFDEATGNISRGIGLTLVKEMVENIFDGTIEFESEFGKGTAFNLRLNCERLQKGAGDERLYIR